MEQVRRDTIHEWSGGASTIGPIPCNLNKRALRSLSQSFTHRENPHENSNPNIAFQRDLDELIEADGEFSDSPSLSRLCSLVAELVHRWEKLEMQSRRMSSSTSSRITTDKGKHFSSDRGKDYAPMTDDLHCMGCNRSGHLRENQDASRWKGCMADQENSPRRSVGNRQRLDQ